MAPISFEGTSRVPQVDPLNLLPSPEARPEARDESFEAHLQAADESRTTHPRREEHPHKPTERSAEEPPAADDPPPNPQADAQEKAPSEHGEADEPAGSENETPAAAAGAEENPDESEEVTVAVDLVLPMDIELSAETPDEELPLAPPEQEPELRSEDTPDEVEEETAGEVKLKGTPRTLQHQEAESSEAQGESAEEEAARAATPQEQEEIAATVNTVKAESSKRSVEKNPSDSKPTATRPVDVAEIAPAPESSSQESEADAEGRRERTRSAAPPPATTKENDPSAAASQRVAQHLVARGGERAAEGVQLNSADQTRFVDRVARAFRAAEGRSGILRLRLSPPELGSMRLEIKVQGGALTARVEADTPTARTLLMDNLPVLRERLAEQGIRVEQFDVELLDRHSNGELDGWEQREQRHTEDGDRSEPQTSAAETTDDPAPRGLPGKHTGGDEQLNVVI